MMWLSMLLACGGEPSEPVAVGEEASEAPAEESPVEEATTPAEELLAELAVPAGTPEVLGVPWLGFEGIPEGMRGCRLDQKFGNAMFDNSVALRCGKGSRILAAKVTTERWKQSANALSVQAESALGDPQRTESVRGWTVKHWTEPRSAVTALLQQQENTVYIGCVDGPTEHTCAERMAQLVTGLGTAPAPE